MRRCSGVVCLSRAQGSIFHARYYSQRSESLLLPSLKCAAHSAAARAAAARCFDGGQRILARVESAAAARLGGDVRGLARVAARVAAGARAHHGRGAAACVVAAAGAGQDGRRHRLAVDRAASVVAGLIAAGVAANVAAGGEAGRGFRAVGAAGHS